MSDVTYALRWKRETKGDGPSTLRSTRYRLDKTVAGRTETVQEGLGHPSMLAIHRRVVELAGGGGPDAAAAQAALDEDWQEEV